MTYQTILHNFQRGLWSAEMVQVAVTTGLITQAQANGIYAGTETISVQDSVEVLLTEMEGILNEQ